MSLLDLKRVLLQEELGQFADLLCHLDTHDFTVALYLGHRVARSETSQWSVIDVE